MRVPNVGTRLRSIREQKSYSLRALAEKCGLSINAISLIERGENSPTVFTLHRLATALNVPITDFFQDDERQTIVHVKCDQGLRSRSDGAIMECLGIGLSNQQLEPFKMTVKPGVGNLEEPISHFGEEFVHCLNGEIDYCVDDRVFRLKQGDSLLFDATLAHAYHNPLAESATLILVFQAMRDSQNVQRMHIVSSE